VIGTFIPSGDVPRTEAAGLDERTWFKNDSGDRYRKDPHPVLKPGDVTYRFNAHGYRCDNFDTRRDLNVIFIGCSWIFGTGVPAESTSCAVFSRLLAGRTGKSVSAWNLGFPGKSNDYVSRVLLCAVPVLKPDVVVVNFTFSARREYIPIDGPELNTLSSPESLKQVEDLARRDLYRHMFALASEREDRMNLFKNYKLVELLLTTQRVRWLYSGNVLHEFSAIEDHIDRARFILPGLQLLDRGRDNSHPGIGSHLNFAEQAFQRFVELYASDHPE